MKRRLIVILIMLCVCVCACTSACTCAGMNAGTLQPEHEPGEVSPTDGGEDSTTAGGENSTTAGAENSTTAGAENSTTAEGEDGTTVGEASSTVGAEDGTTGEHADAVSPTAGAEVGTPTGGENGTTGEHAGAESPISGAEDGTETETAQIIWERPGVQDAFEAANPYEGSFWTKNFQNDTELLLTEEQIREINRQNANTTGTGLVDLSQVSGYTVDELLAMIEQYTLSNRPFFDNRELQAATKELLLQSRNFQMLRENGVELAYGVLTANTDLRSFPTALRLTEEPQGRFDYLQETRLLIGEPVLVLHCSTDGAWCFVQAENYCGWIREAVIAYCDRAEFLTVYESISAIKQGVTKPVVVIKNGSYQFGKRTEYLRMGTSLPSDGGKNIFLPGRDENGRLFWEEYPLPSTDATGETCFVHGYLPLNRANVSRLSVRLMGSPYAWGDALSFGEDSASAGDNGMDCSSTVAAVYRCFGFAMPRNTGAQKQMHCTQTISLADVGLTLRRERLGSLRGGELLFGPGHVMLYLGEVDGVFYILHNTTGYALRDGGREEFYRCVITDMSLGKKGASILERLLQVCSLY